MVFSFASCGVVSFFGCFVLSFCVLLFHSSPQKTRRRKTKKNATQQENTKKQKCIKKEQTTQVAQLCSQLVFLNYGAGLKHANFLLETLKKWFQQF